MELVSQVKHLDEGSLADEVDRLREHAARETEKGSRAIEEEMERQHEGVKQLLRRVKEEGAGNKDLPDEVLNRQYEAEEKQFELIDDVRNRRIKGGKHDDEVDISVEADAIRHQEVEDARQRAVQEALEQQRRERQMLHRQTFEMNAEINAVKARPVRNVAQDIARSRTGRAAAGGPERRSRRFELMKSLLKRQRLRRIIGRHGGSITRETDRLKKAITIERIRQNKRMESLLAPHPLDNPQAHEDGPQGSDDDEPRDAEEDRQWLRDRTAPPSRPSRDSADVSPRTRRLHGSLAARGGSPGQEVEIRSGKRGAVLIIGS